MTQDELIYQADLELQKMILTKRKTLQSNTKKLKQLFQSTQDNITELNLLLQGLRDTHRQRTNQVYAELTRQKQSTATQEQQKVQNLCKRKTIDAYWLDALDISPKQHRPNPLKQPKVVVNPLLTTAKFKRELLDSLHDVGMSEVERATLKQMLQDLGDKL